MTEPLLETRPPSLDSLCNALGQPLRVNILRVLQKLPKDGAPLGLIAERTGVRPSVCSHHCMELHRIGLLEREATGRFAWYKLNRSTLLYLINELMSIHEGNSV